MSTMCTTQLQLPNHSSVITQQLNSHVYNYFVGINRVSEVPLALTLKALFDDKFKALSFRVLVVKSALAGDAVEPRFTTTSPQIAGHNCDKRFMAHYLDHSLRLEGNLQNWRASLLDTHMGKNCDTS